MLYKSVLRPFLFSLDPEVAHDRVIKLGALAQNVFVRRILEFVFSYEDPRLAVNLFGLSFKNPLGLAAGFDKNCRCPRLLAALGFSHIEFGTITSIAQVGNSKPRMFRLPSDSALINRMGFPSEGVDNVLLRLAALKGSGFGPVIGINIGKSKVISLEAATQDYLDSFSKLYNFGDYFVLNVSSPNTPELRKLQERGRLADLVQAIQEVNTAAKPLLVKVAPDLSDQELDDVLELCLEKGVSGVIATNTTLSRDGLSVPTEESGGLSGKPLRSRALTKVKRIYSVTEGKLPIIGIGGISSAQDVVDFMCAGASLVQIYSALVFEGPNLVKKIKCDLSKFVQDRGINSISEIVGKALF